MKLNYVLWRCFQVIPTLLLIGIVVFVLTRALPGDTISTMLGDRATDEAVRRLTHQFGLDQPILVQFTEFIEALRRGELGTSIAFHVPVTQLIAERLPATLMLTGLATLLALILAIPLAFVSAIYANRWPDLVIRTLFQIGLSSPIFYVGLILLTVFAAWMKLFPVGGYGQSFADNLYHLFLPALTLALSFSAVIMRNLRASILQVLHAEFVEFAMAKGLSPNVIMRRHILRNAAIAAVTLVGLQIGQLLGGAVITETVFAVPGVGRLMVESIFARDYPVIQMLTLVLAVLVSAAFLLTDLLQMWLDPRIAR
jgi:peptide/nickel transport system permease protein